MSRFRTLIVSFLVFFAVIGCERSGTAGGSPSNTAVFPKTVVDDLGTSLTIPRKPQKIVSVTLPTDEILLALVDKSRLLGVTTFSEDTGVSNVASQVFDIPNKVTLNVEVLVSIQPDLVFVADWSKAEDVDQLRKAGLTVYRYKSPLTVMEIESRITRIGEVVGEEAKASALVEWMERRLSTVVEKLAALHENGRLTVMDYNTWGTSMGKGSSWDDIVRLAGLKNAVGDLAADQWGQVPISLEKLLDIEPDILLLPGWVYGDPGGSDAFYRSIVQSPALRGMRAVKTGRVYRLSEKEKTSTSQYIVFAVEDLAKLAYPDLFK
jgi:iron complex transport system substrate-binding protein